MPGGGSAARVHSAGVAVHVDDWCAASQSRMMYTTNTNDEHSTSHTRIARIAAPTRMVHSSAATIGVRSSTDTNGVYGITDTYGEHSVIGMNGMQHH